MRVARLQSILFVRAQSQTRTMTSSSSRQHLVLSGVQTLGGKDRALAVLNKDGPISVLWCVPLGLPHLGTLALLNKIADFLQAGLHVKILLTDGPCLLESLHLPFEVTRKRHQFRQRALQAALRSVGAIGVDSRVHFIGGLSGSVEGEFRREGDWTMKFYSLASVTASDTARAAAEGLVASAKHAPLSELLLPIIQTVDEQELNADIHYGRAEQKASFAFAETVTAPERPESAVHLVGPSICSFFGSSTSSAANGHIYLHERPNKRINSAFAEEGLVHGNGLLAFLRLVVFPVSARLDAQDASPFVTGAAPGGTLFTINRLAQYGGPLHFSDADAVESAYASKILHPKDLKSGVIDAVNVLLQPIVESFGTQDQFEKSAALAYPPSEKGSVTAKKDKKTRRPAELRPDLIRQTSRGTPVSSIEQDAAIVQKKVDLITRGLFDDGLQAAGTAAIRKTLSANKVAADRLMFPAAHIGYFVPLIKIADFLEAGIHVKILLADVHAFLDNLKAPIALVRRRTEYYSRVIKAALASIGVPRDRLEFVVGSSYQTSTEYTNDVLRITSLVSEHDARKAGADVVKQSETPPLSGLVYPLMQAIDEQHLDVDIQFGGLDQRKIFTLAQQSLPKIGYFERSHLMNPMIPGLQGGKMSSSEQDSKIDFLDSPAVVNRKIATAGCDPSQPIESNGLLAFTRAVIMPVAELRLASGSRMISPFVSSNAPVGALLSVGPHHFASADNLEEGFRAGEVEPQDIRSAVANAINHLLAPILAHFASDPSFRAIEAAAYSTHRDEQLVNGVAELSVVNAAR